MIDTGGTVVARNHTSGKARTVPIRALYQNNPKFYAISGGSYDYLVTEETAREVLHKLKKYDEQKAKEPRTRRQDSSPTFMTPVAGSDSGLQQLITPNFGEEYRRIEELPPEERLSLLERSRALLKELSEKADATPEEVNEALVTTTTDAALANKTSIQEALRMGNEEAKQYTEELVSATQEMLRTTALLVDNKLYNEELIGRVVERSNGTVVQHMTRVFLTGFAFMLYYNRQILTSSLANRIRINFPRRYKKHTKSSYHTCTRTISTWSTSSMAE